MKLNIRTFKVILPTEIFNLKVYVHEKKINLYKFLTLITN